MKRTKRQQEVDSQVDTQESTNWNFQKKKSERILLDTLGISRYAFLLGHSPIALSGVMESFVARSAERQTLCARVAHVIAPRLGSAGVQKASKSKT
jgi:hypothetical protein